MILQVIIILSIFQYAFHFNRKLNLNKKKKKLMNKLIKAKLKILAFFNLIRTMNYYLHMKHNLKIISLNFSYKKLNFLLGRIFLDQIIWLVIYGVTCFYFLSPRIKLFKIILKVEKKKLIIQPNIFLFHWYI